MTLWQQAIQFAPAEEVFPGKLLLFAPHFDDEVLACGGTLALLPDKENIHIAYATDGSRSPIPTFGWQGQPSSDLHQIRRQEARQAACILGIPETNLIFFDLEDHRLSNQRTQLYDHIASALQKIEPDHVLVPFRYDRHPDHLALNAAVKSAVYNLGFGGSLFEYFVYYRYRMIPGGDLRAWVRKDRMVGIHTQTSAAQKKGALQAYQSQTTRFFPWQSRAILPEGRVDEVSQAPEIFLRSDHGMEETPVFTQLGTWIRIVHYVEPRLKQWKDTAVTILRGRKRTND